MSIGFRSSLLLAMLALIGARSGFSASAESATPVPPAGSATPVPPAGSATPTQLEEDEVAEAPFAESATPDSDELQATEQGLDESQPTALVVMNVQEFMGEIDEDHLEAIVKQIHDAREKSWPIIVVYESFILGELGRNGVHSDVRDAIEGYPKVKVIGSQRHCLQIRIKSLDGQIEELAKKAKDLLELKSDRDPVGPEVLLRQIQMRNSTAGAGLAAMLRSVRDHGPGTVEDDAKHVALKRLLREELKLDRERASLRKMEENYSVGLVKLALLKQAIWEEEQAQKQKKDDSDYCRKDIKQLVVCGMSTDHLLSQAVRELAADTDNGHGFQVVVRSEACAVGLPKKQELSSEADADVDDQKADAVDHRDAVDQPKADAMNFRTAVRNAHVRLRRRHHQTAVRNAEAEGGHSDHQAAVRNARLRRFGALDDLNKLKNVQVVYSPDDQKLWKELVKTSPKIDQLYAALGLVFTGPLYRCKKKSESESSSPSRGPSRRGSTVDDGDDGNSDFTDGEDPDIFRLPEGVDVEELKRQTGPNTVQLTEGEMAKFVAAKDATDQDRRQAHANSRFLDSKFLDLWRSVTNAAGLDPNLSWPAYLEQFKSASLMAVRKMTGSVRPASDIDSSPARSTPGTGVLPPVDRSQTDSPFQAIISGAGN